MGIQGNDSCKLLGVLGGMGPEATLSFFSKVISKTPANKDQDHIPMVIFNNTKIPDRTNSILKGQDNVLPLLIDGIKFLIDSGVDLIAIPCVSAHFYYQELVKEATVPILSIIDETVSSIAINAPGIKKVGILGTTLTIRKKLFVSAFEGLNIDTVVPCEDTQEDSIMKAIYLVKAGDKKMAREMIENAISELISKGVQAIVAGCTELPLIVDSRAALVPVVDTLDCLAAAVVREII